MKQINPIWALVLVVLLGNIATIALAVQLLRALPGIAHQDTRVNVACPSPVR